MIKGIVFDADGTLLEVENPYLSIARGLMCEKQVVDWVKEYLSGNLNYHQLVTMEEKLFSDSYLRIYKSHPKTGDLERFFSPPHVRDEAGKLFVDLAGLNIQPFVLSSGFYYLVKELYQLNIPHGNIHSNRFLYDTEGEFMGIKMNVSGEKIEGFNHIVQKSGLNISEVAYVGDNAFDLKLIQYVLDNSGWVFLFDQAEKDFRINTIPSSDHLMLINNLNEIVVKLEMLLG
jgi:phosphoserine phosphatase